MKWVYNFSIFLVLINLFSGCKNPEPITIQSQEFHNAIDKVTEIFDG